MEKTPRSILVLGWVVGVLYLLRIVTQLFPFGLVEEMMNSATAPSAQLGLGLVLMGVTFGNLAISGLSGLLFFIWSYLAHENARSLAPGATLSYGPAVMVWSYFIPFVNLVLPYSAMREVFSASDAAAGAGDDDNYRLDRSGSALLLAWWLMHLVTSIIVTISALQGLTGSDELSVIATQAPFVIVSGALNFAWCIYLSRLQERAIARRPTRP